MNIKPLGDNVVIRQATQEEVTASGLLLPGNKDEKKNEGVVVAVGPGRLVNGTLVPTVVKVDDKVLLKHWGGDVVKVGADEYKIVPETEILATLE